MKLTGALGYDFDTVELAVRDGVPYAIDFLNPAPDADAASIGPDNFAWVVEHSAKWLVERVRGQVSDLTPLRSRAREWRKAGDAARPNAAAEAKKPRARAGAKRPRPTPPPAGEV
jgi:hypothetical protein